jgi:hypothetical protein
MENNQEIKVPLVVLCHVLLSPPPLLFLFSFSF